MEVPVRLGSSSDFVVPEGIAHLDSGNVESLGAGWTAVCGVTGNTLQFLDSTGTLLRRYQPGQGVHTLATRVQELRGNCFGPSKLFLGDPVPGVPVLGDTGGARASLLRYDVDTGAVSVLATDVADRIGGTALHLFVFQHPDALSGDLLLLDADGAGLLPLRARARLQTEFIEARGRVAFLGGAAGEEPQEMIANLDGSGARTVGPRADRILFSADGRHLLLEAGGLLWVESPQGPAIPLDELGRMGQMVISDAGDVVVYSVLSGDRRGAWRVDLWTGARAFEPSPAGLALFWPPP